jgi:hypothetical protein
MTNEEFRAEMDRVWESANREATELKDSFLALDRLYAWYRRLDDDRRGLADDNLASWLHSPDEAKRFDAIALVREFGIVSAIPALRDLGRRLQANPNASARFEREKVEGLVAELSSR